MVIPVEVREVIGRFASNPDWSTITKFWGKLFPIILGVILNLFHIFSKKMNFKNSWTISVCRILILRQTSSQAEIFRCCHRKGEEFNHWLNITKTVNVYQKWWFFVKFKLRFVLYKIINSVNCFVWSQYQQCGDVCLMGTILNFGSFCPSFL